MEISFMLSSLISPSASATAGDQLAAAALDAGALAQQVALLRDRHQLALQELLGLVELLLDDRSLAVVGAALRLEAAHLFVELDDLQAQLLLLVGDHAAVGLNQPRLARHRRRRDRAPRSRRRGIVAFGHQPGMGGGQLLQLRPD